MSTEKTLFTPRKDILGELNKENRNLKVVLTPIKLRQSGVVPSAKDKVLSQCGQTDFCLFTDVFSSQ